MTDLLANFVGNPPCTVAEVEAAEAKTDFRLRADYREFLLRCFNGGEGSVGDGSYLILWQADELAEFNAGYEVAAYCPKLLLIGSDGCGEAFGLDYSRDEVPLVQVPFVGMEPKAIQHVGASFELFLQALSQRR